MPSRPEPFWWGPCSPFWPGTSRRRPPRPPANRPAPTGRGAPACTSTEAAKGRHGARAASRPGLGARPHPVGRVPGASPLTDPAGDVPGGQLDVVSYKLPSDCGVPNWTFSVTTQGGWNDISLYALDYVADIDQNPYNNCDGFDRDVFGFWDGGHLVAVVLALGAPAPGQPCPFVQVATAVISRPNLTRVDMVFSNAALGNPSSLAWFGQITDSPFVAPDEFPDAGNFVGDAGLPCPTAASSDGTTRYYVADVDAGRAGAALRKAGLRDVKARPARS